MQTPKSILKPPAAKKFRPDKDGDLFSLVEKNLDAVKSLQNERYKFFCPIKNKKQASAYLAPKPQMNCLEKVSDDDWMD